MDVPVDDYIMIDDNDDEFDYCTNLDYHNLSMTILSTYIKTEKNPSLYKIFRRISKKIIFCLKEKFKELKKSGDVNEIFSKLLGICKNNDKLSFFVYPSNLLYYLSYIIAVNLMKCGSDSHTNYLNDFYYKFHIIPSRKRIPQKVTKNNEAESFLNHKEEPKGLIATFISTFTQKTKQATENNPQILRKNIKRISIHHYEKIKQCFSTFKKIVILFSNSHINSLTFMCYIYFTFNFPWMFENLMEIEINTINSNLFIGLGRDELKNNDEENNLYFLLIEFFYYFGLVSKLSVENLLLIIPYMYTKEINNAIDKSEKFPNSNNEEIIHLLDFMQYKFVNLKTFYVEFNMLDNLTFKNLIGFLNENDSIVSLEISLFPKDNVSILLSLQQIKNICHFEILLNKDKVNEDEFMSYNDVDFYLKYLYKSFQINIKNLLSSIKNKLLNLNKLFLYFDLPDFLTLNTDYCTCFIEFIIEIFQNLMEDDTIQTLEIRASNLFFDGSKYIDLPDRIDNLKLENNTTLNYLVLNLKIFNLQNLIYLLPSELKELELCDLDIDTFTIFIEDIALLKNLKLLKLSVYNAMPQIEENFEVLKLFFEGKYFPNKLIKTSINIKMFLSIEMIESIFCDKIIKDKYVQELEIKLNYEKITNNKLSFEKLNKKLSFMVSQNEKNIYYTRKMAYMLREKLLGAMIKKKLILCHDLNEEINYNGYDDRKTLISLFGFLSKYCNKKLKVELLQNN